MRDFLWSTIATTRGDVNRVVVNVTHGDVGDNDVFHASLIHFLEGESAAVEAGAVGNRDVAIASVAFCAEFDASAYPVDFLWNVGAIENGANLVASDDAVGDEDVLADLGTLEGITTLKDDGIIMRRVDFRVAYGGESAAVDVDTIPVGVNQHVVDGGEVTSCDDDGEVSTTIDGDVANKYVATEFEGNRLVACADASSLHIACGLGVLTGETFAIDASTARDADVFEVLAPNERIMEIGVASVLVFREIERLGRVVGFAVAGGNDGGSCIDVEIDVALHVDGTTKVVACRKENGATSIGSGFLNGGVDGRRIEVLAIAFGSEITNVVGLSGGKNEE